MKKFTVLPLVALSSLSFALSHGVTLTPEQMTWQSGPASLPKGVMFAVLEGDPTKAGPFTIRLKTPDDYTIPPHSHTAIEHVTVISGAVDVGMGDKVDLSKSTHLAEGGFFFMDPNTYHFAYTKNSTILQLHGIGPWSIDYLDQKDDPRNKQ